MTARRRKAPGRRWSASSSVQWLDGRGTTLARTPTAEAPPGAVKARVHYRLDGASRKPTLTGDDLPAQVAALQGLLAAAYVHDWDADPSGLPRPPVPLPPAAGTSPAPAGAGREESPAAVAPLPRTAVGTALLAPAGPAVIALPGTGPSQEPLDVASVAGWHLDRARSTFKRQGGRRSPTTTDNYASELAFLVEHARYLPGDHRLELLGLEPGASLRCDDPAAGVSEADLMRLLEIRASTNLRVRAANERALASWANACAAEERRAARERRAPQLPPVPDQAPEQVNERTIESFARTTRAMFVAAHRYGKIPYQPWTPAVGDEVVRAPAVHYSTRTLPSRDQVQLIVEAIATVRRPSTGRDGRPVEAMGERYQAMVWLAGRLGLRPEESIAVRYSWVVLDDGDPRVELHWAETYHSQPGGGRERARVPLKQRRPGEVRIVRPDSEDRAEFVSVMGEHRRAFVGPDGREPGADDPYFFTTHWGLPVDLSNFGQWWKPAVRDAFCTPDTQQFADLPFRRLRAAAITDWLVRGATTEEAAAKAGNSQAVLEKHYKGVIDARPARQRRPQPADLVDAVASMVSELDGAQLGALFQVTKDELCARLADDT